MKKLRITVLLLLMASFSQLDAQVLINEFSAANYSDFTDNYGENEDWIELYNAGASSVSLNGHYLSDKLDNPTKWTFPNGTSIAAGEHMVIFASGRDVTSGGNLHTNFKLTQTKGSEVILLSDPSEAPIALYELNAPNKVNESTGRISDGDANWGIMENPTPGNPNTNVKQFYATQPDSSPDPGLFTGSVDVTLSSPDPGVSIRYTTNGADPTAGSTLYAGPITLTETTVIRAIAINPDPDIPNSFIETSTYFVDDVHSIPVVSISGGSGIANLFGGDQSNPDTTFELFDENQVFLDESSGESNKHGNDSWAYDQRGIDYIARDQFGYGHAVEHEIFGTTDRDKFQRLMLKAAANDNYPESDGAHIRDAYLHELSQRANMDMDERSNEPCIVYLNGEYWGVYEMREKVDDIDYTKYYYDQDEGDVQFIKTWGWTWEEYGSPQALNEWNNLHNYIVSNDMSNDANYEYVEERLNVLSLIDYIILNTHAVCSDWLNYNTGWWRGLNPDGGALKWRYILWDLDASFGHYINYTGIPDTGANADPCDNEAPGISDPEGHVDILVALYENQDFYDMYINRYADLNNTYFTCDYMIDLLDEMIGRIEPEMQRQIDKWGGSMTGWQNNVQALEDFILTRCTAINDGLVDCYELEGPFDLTVDLTPVGAGTVQVNTFIPDAYPYLGSYYGGVNVTLTAEAEEGYVFSHWEIIPDITADHNDPVLSFEMTESMSIVAHFIEEVPQDLTVLVEPLNAGNVVLNTNLLSSYPFTISALAGTEMSVEAIAADCYVFDYWEINNHTIDPATNPTALFDLAVTDTLIAHFVNETAQLNFFANPPGAGSIDFNGTILNTWPTQESMNLCELVNLEAIPAEGYIFDYWEISNHNITDNTASITSFEFNNADNVIAHFTENLGHIEVSTDPIGSISIDGQPISTPTYEADLPVGTEVVIDATPPAGYEFDYWEVNGEIVNSGNPSYTHILAYGEENDVIAIFRAVACSLALPNVFTPNSDGANDVFRPLYTNCNFNSYQLTIYNRWGKIVYQSNDINQSWKADDAEIGVYVYMLSYQVSEGEEIRDDFRQGNITLLR